MLLFCDADRRMRSNRDEYHWNCMAPWLLINTFRLRQIGRHFPDDIFKCIFLNENVQISIKISLKFVPNCPIDNIPALVQIMAWCWPGDKPLSEPMLVMFYWCIYVSHSFNELAHVFIVRRAGLLWSQQDFEWRWSVPLFKCLTVLEFSFILFDLCLLITFFNFIMNYIPIVTFWIFTYHKIWILSIMFCSIWSYWIIYFLACLEVSWRVVS